MNLCGLIKKFTTSNKYTTTEKSILNTLKQISVIFGEAVWETSKYASFCFKNYANNCFSKRNTLVLADSNRFSMMMPVHTAAWHRPDGENLFHDFDKKIECCLPVPLLMDLPVWSHQESSAHKKCHKSVLFEANISSHWAARSAQTYSWQWC